VPVRGLEASGRDPGLTPEDAGAEFVLVGLVQANAGRTRVSARFVEVANGRVIWADRYDIPDRDTMFDEAVRGVLAAVEAELVRGDLARIDNRTARRLDAWIHRTRGEAELWTFSRGCAGRARLHYVAARDLDPDWPVPWGCIAWSHWWEAKHGWAESRSDAIAAGVAHAEKAIDLGPDEPIGYMQLGNLVQLQRDHERAIALRERALRLAPNDFGARFGFGGVLLRAGETGRALSVYRRAADVIPRPPTWLHWCIAHAELVAGDVEGAALSADRAHAPGADTPEACVIAAMAYAAAGRTADARRSVLAVLALEPDYTVTAWRRTQEEVRDRGAIDRLARLLVSAGMRRD
jgi:tetratricopeptide (TPR) repeat protein